MTVFDKRPGPWLRFFFKVPLWIHKMGFGGWEKLVGAQWMLIATTGRKTGKRREVMVDVMDYDQAADAYYVEAAYGVRADWVKNIQSTPVLEAQVGRRKFHARAALLSNEGTADMLVQFYRRKPAYTRSVMAMVGMKFKGEDDLRALSNKLTLFAIKPEED